MTSKPAPSRITRAALAALLAAAAAAPVCAQTGAVVTVDLERIYAESAAAKNAITQMQARYNAPNQQAVQQFEAARTAYGTQVQAAQKALNGGTDASKLPPATQQQLGQAQDRLEQARSQALAVQQAIQDSQAYVRDQIVQAVLPIAEQVRAEKKATLVVPRGSALASDPAADITSVVLPRLDQRLTSVQIVRPQAAPPASAPAGPTPPAAAPAAPARGRPATQGR